MRRFVITVMISAVLALVCLFHCHGWPMLQTPGIRGMSTRAFGSSGSAVFTTRRQSYVGGGFSNAG
jgi:hypothetical protein